MLSDELRTLLVNEGLGRADVDLFLGDFPFEPPAPNACTAIADTGGTAPDFVNGVDGISIEYPRAQIKTRGKPKDYAGPRVQIERIYQFLSRASVRTVSGTRHCDLSPVQSPFLLGRDDQSRWMFAFNIQSMKEPSGTT